MRTLLLAFVLVGCVSRKEVEADIWQVKPMPAAACVSYKNAGFFRKIICKTRAQHPLCQDGAAYYYEVISFCKVRAGEMLAMTREDAVKWLGEVTAPQ